MNRLFTFVVFLFLCFLCSSCNSNDDVQNGKSKSSKKDNQKVLKEKTDDDIYESIRGEKITVVLPQSEVDFSSFYEKKTRLFEELSGVEVNFINLNRIGCDSLIFKSLEAQDSAYDVIEFDHVWTKKFLENDWVEPLDAYVSQSMLEGMVPGLLDMFSKDGSLYGITWNNDIRFFMYNRRILESVGVNTPPLTWEDISALDEALRGNGILINSMMDSFNRSRSGLVELFYMVRSFGGRFFDDDGTPVMGENLKTLAAYSFIKDGFATGMIDKNSLIMDYESESNVFCMGESAFMTQAWSGIYALANDSSLSSVNGDIVVSLEAPHAADEASFTLNLPEAMAIPKTSKHKKAAWAYIEFMTSKKTDKEKSMRLGSLPVWTNLYSDDSLLRIYPYWSDFARQVSIAITLPSVFADIELAKIIVNESARIFQDEVSLSNGLREMQKLCEKHLKNIKRK